MASALHLLKRVFLVKAVHSKVMCKTSEQAMQISSGLQIALCPFESCGGMYVSGITIELKPRMLSIMCS